MIDGLRLFKLRDNRHVALVRGNDLLGFGDIGGGPDEGESDGVNSVLKAEFQVLTVFRRQSRNGKRHAGEIDTLLFTKQAAVNDVTQNVFASKAADSKFDEAITEQNSRTGRQFAGKIGKRG